jgi:tetratricopeptide (TPR) repeat protein
MAGALIRRAESRAYGSVGDGKIRVLCLGESTTASTRGIFDYSWPALLQARLDADIGPKFEIVNRGRSATRTSVIADRLPWTLDAERPQIVITMMGVNDDGYEGLRLASQKPHAIRLVRIWRWARREIGRDIWVAKLQRRARSQRPEDEARREEACAEVRALRLYSGAFDLCVSDTERSRRDWKVILSSGALLWSEGRRADAEDRFERALLAAPAEATAVHAEIASFLLTAGESAGFERHWRAAWAAHPWDEDLVDMRFTALLMHSRWTEAEALAREMAARHPENALGHTLLFEIARRRKDSAAEALREGEASHRLEPGNHGVTIELARIYTRHGRTNAADALMTALSRKKGLSHRGLEVANYYAKRGLTAQAEEIYFRTVAEENAHRSTVEKFAEKLLQMERRGEAARLYDVLDAQRNSVFGGVLSAQNDETRENYERIGSMLRARGIVWIAMQYPLRPLKRLRELTAGFPEAILVENRRNFLDAERAVPPPWLFIDHFAGDFGHCTRAGNALLAASAAKALRAAVR